MKPFTMRILWRTCGRPRIAAAELVVQDAREFDKHVADLSETLKSLLATGYWSFARAARIGQGGAASGGRWICCGSGAAGR